MMFKRAMARGKSAAYALRDFSSWKTSTRLALAFVILSVGAILIVFRQNNVKATEVLTAAQSEIMTDLASSLAIQVDSQVLQYRREAAQAASDPDVIAFMGAPPGAGDPGAVNERVKPLLRSDADAKGFILAGTDGQVKLASDPAFDGKNVSETDYFKFGSAAPSTEPYVSDLAPPPGGGPQVLYASAPVRDALGHPLGVAVVELTPLKIPALLSAKKLAGAHRYGFLLSREGVVLANSLSGSLNYSSLGSLDSVQQNSVKKRYGVALVPSVGQDEFAQQAVGASTAGFGSARLLDRKGLDVVGWAPVEGERWTILVAESQSVFTAGVRDLSQSQVFNSLFLVLVIGGLAIVGGRVFEGAEKESLSDPLTGLANRRFFHDVFLRELRRSQRYSKPLSIILCDIDHFKAINDTHGHHVGDEVLEHVADVMLSIVRATDFVIRYGGEEFLVLLPETPLAESVKVAQKIGRALEESEVDSGVRPGLKVKVTLSAGVSCFPEDGEASDTLVMKADKALYYAKENGRNRVCSSAEVSTGV